MTHCPDCGNEIATSLNINDEIVSGNGQAYECPECGAILGVGALH